jgi:adenylate cyclase
MRSVTTRNLRLISGLVLFAFTATHFLNHAVGLFSLEAMDEVQEWRLLVTRSWPGMLVLGAALITHVVLALAKTLRRATLRLPAWEIAQLATGLIIPILLLPHIIDTHVANSLFGVQDSYLYALARLWPAAAWTQSLLLLLVWSHGCLGLHHWLKFSSWYRRSTPLWVVVAVAIPMAALMGFIVSGRFVSALLSDPAMAERMRGVTHWPDVAEAAWLALYATVARVGFAIVLALVAIGVAFRQFGMLAAPKIAISYAGGPEIQAPVGPTLLEISRSQGVMHVSACGGRARCGQCQVRIDEGGDGLASAGSAERATLAHVKAPANARLACQIRPTAPLSVTRLLLSGDAPAMAAAPDRGDNDAGVRKPLCLLHVHLRELDAIARDRLAYDLVFIMNEFFGAVAQAIESHGGRVDRFLGDSVLAVFGEQGGLDQGCADAINAARALDLALDRVNEKVAAEIGRPMRASMGVYAGEMVLGRIGLPGGRVSVLGLGADIPQRLAGFAGQNGWQLALSTEVARRAGVAASDADHRAVLAATSEAGVATELIGVIRSRDIAMAAVAAPAATAP